MKVLIVGAGLYGAVCAHELTRRGHRCTVLDKREHIGGHAYTRYHADVRCHEYVYGAPVFHTDAKPIWDYVNRFAEFRPYEHRVKVAHGAHRYSFPINLMTLQQVFGTSTPRDAHARLAAERIPCAAPETLEQACLATLGPTLYRLFIEGYTVKQWGRHPAQLPAAFTARLPVRLSFDDRYVSDRYQGLPLDGYTPMIARMLAGSDVHLGIDFLYRRDDWLKRYPRVIYTGPIDAFFDERFGPLAYRTLRLEREVLPVADFQGAPVVHYAESTVPYTRIIEHKHFDAEGAGAGAASTVLPEVVPAGWSGAPAAAPATGRTLITRVYLQAREPGQAPDYPVNDAWNTLLSQRYRQAAESLAGHVHFGGRLAEYRDYRMHQVIRTALAFCARA
ncbi:MULTISPECIES: UDP-galactopyranose/dTDP-fucopyranose mutase family protein [Burkholderia]|uniref:UDP-galactopyranose/dTDP-fucopyranose mutase family protein n=1 Tax=Burkholderia TaxID=32008 RepID=UPI0008415A33|nr:MULTISPECIES: FAD-dependent oxidoreductase [unclassified Burkholderia]AOK29066.1 hypothetical protein AQ611_06130 [Burkholderia sp. Bp7605]